MRGITLLPVILVTITAALSIGREKRQADDEEYNVELERCFQIWKEDTLRWMKTVEKLTEDVLNRLINPGGNTTVFDLADIELRAQFGAVFSPNTQPTDEECEEQLRDTKAKLRKAIQEQLNSALATINRLLQEAQSVWGQLISSISSLWGRVVGGMNRETNSTVTNAH